MVAGAIFAQLPSAAILPDPSRATAPRLEEPAMRTSQMKTPHKALVSEPGIRLKKLSKSREIRENKRIWGLGGLVATFTVEKSSPKAP